MKPPLFKPASSTVLVGRLCFLGIAAFVSSGRSICQAPPSSGQPTQQVSQLPLTTQIKKTIVFLETDCLHDFNREFPNIAHDRLLELSPDQRKMILGQLTMLTIRLRGLRQGLEKLAPDEVARLMPSPIADKTPDQIMDEIDWRMRVLIKMTSLTDQEISTLSDADLSLIPTDAVRGTGFFVGYRDDRIKLKPGETGPKFWSYLVTNRHVTQPGIEHGTPCRIIKANVLLNHTPDSNHASDFSEVSRIDKQIKWVTPQDESVDLAAAQVSIDESLYDHIVIPDSEFVTEDEIKKHKVVEGDPVLFAGLFIQTFDQVHTLEPIVRAGSLAMIPEGPLQMTIGNRFGKVYLAEAHAFGGNSGSPMFVDPEKYSGLMHVTPQLKFLGVLSGEVYENADLTLNLTSSISGSTAANSGISVVVPATEVMKLLENPTLKAARDLSVAQQSQ